MTPVEEALYTLAFSFEEIDRRSGTEGIRFSHILDELFFQSAFRFKDYKQYSEEGEFAVRVQNWIENVSNEREQRALFMLLRWLVFIDSKQMLSMYRDAYRRVIVPWITDAAMSAKELLSPEYPMQLIRMLRKYSLHSLTESFALPTFLQINDLSGLPKPKSFDDDPKQVDARLPITNTECVGAILFEDFVGTGKQAAKVLLEVCRIAPVSWRILFVPLIILETGQRALQGEPKLNRVSVQPILVIPDNACLKKDAAPNEPREFPWMRSVVLRTAKRVLARFHEHDDPPDDAFGYKGSGALVVTCHNTPNNSVALIHHRAPRWAPLFRRLHHSKDSLK